MKKYFVYVLCSVLLGTVSASAQNDSQLSPSKPTKLFKVNNPEKDKIDQFDILALGGTTFTASNTADGSSNSFRHSLRIVVTLLPVNKTGNPNFQLNFYAANDNVEQAASYNEGVLNIYYPLAVYEDVRARIEQALAAKKKVVVKVVQKPNGYREGTLIL